MVTRWGRDLHLMGRGQGRVAAAPHQQRCVWVEKEEEELETRGEKEGTLDAGQRHRHVFILYLISQTPNALRSVGGGGEGRGKEARGEEEVFFHLSSTFTKPPACILLKRALGRLRGLDRPLGLSELSTSI